jgi:protein involved in ribonucleotide reduction
MLVVYDSLTGNVRRFVDKLRVDSVQLEDSLIVGEPFYLVTYTIGFGQVPISTSRFLRLNGNRMLGVAASGNKNWGNNFAKSASIISSEFNVPIIHRFELAGTVDDVDVFMQEVGRCRISQSGFSTTTRS